MNNCKRSSSGALPYVKAFAFAVGLLCGQHIANAMAVADYDQQLKQVDQYLRSDPQQARSAISALEPAQNEFTPAQLLHFELLKSSMLGFFNQHRERIAYINGIIDSQSNPDTRSKFLYQLSSSYLALGEYEKALDVMNTSIALLPRVTVTIAKMDTLQSAIILLNSLHAYNEALTYADRMYSLQVQNQDLAAKCIASSDRVEIYMQLNQRGRAREQIKEAIDLCDKQGWTYISQIVKALAAIDLIDNQEYAKGIAAGLPALRTEAGAKLGLDFVSRLEEALARAYLQTGKLAQAEQYGLQAYQHAESQKLVQETEKSLETLTQIKRVQGQYAAALSYADLALIQKNALLDDQLQKNVAYQRVKFNMQDQVNQVSLLEKQNKILAIEKQLEKKNSQNLWLLIALALIVASALGLYLWTVIRQKNFFRSKTEIDGLTKICNRSHFMTTAEKLVNGRTATISLILFDMDFFKRINDSFGHPVGDWVLSTVCQTVREVLRPEDLFGRLGGEEFAICLPNTDQITAWQLAQRCRAAIAAIDTAPSGFQFPLTASFGVASLSQHGSGNYSELLVAADKALYQAKSEGRNCVSS